MRRPGPRLGPFNVALDARNHRLVFSSQCASDVAQNNFARTPPANRHQIADAAAHDQTRCAELMAQVVVRVKNCSGKQAVAELERNELAAMQVSGENEVIADASRRLPDPRVVRAEHSNVTGWLSSRSRDRTLKSRENCAGRGRCHHESMHRHR